MSNSNNNSSSQHCHLLTVEPQKFSINELVAALQLFKDQEEIFKAHQGTATVGFRSRSPHAHRQTCYTCGTKTPEAETKPTKIVSAVSDILTALLANDGMSPSTAIVLD
ncbi:hypothetical protein EDB19DRAFT_1830942 [Suillus lakei]|nr:hypothetical protein EDB19DRAFT_1830942 [Suillus lakei]